MLIETPGNKMIPYFTDPDKGRYKELRIHHSLDIWHGAKNLSKKIAIVSSNTSNFIHNTTLYRPACQLNHCILLDLHAKIHARNNLHCLFCLSPQGRKFERPVYSPSLVEGCSQPFLAVLQESRYISAVSCKQDEYIFLIQ